MKKVYRKFSLLKFVHLLGAKYKIWKDGFHPIEKLTLKYIHNNPVEEEIVFRVEEYKYSSAGFYPDGESLLKSSRI